ncbi:MAG: c-type cytochrome [Nitrospinae bacterium]|nr:c-type cytochrome [Nitrospinota bacterium]
MGKRLFHSYCSICHGDDGVGKGPLAAKLKGLKRPVADLTGEKYQKMNSQQLLDLIKGYNREITNMPKWENVIPDKNLKNVAAYILLLTQKDIRMRGDARRGREIFRQSCVACHGQNGEGNGVLVKMLEASKIPNMPSKGHSQISDEEMIKIITNGKGEVMPPWGGVLSSEEIKDVAAYVHSMYKK